MAVLRLKLAESDLDRADVLAAKSRAGKLTPKENQELDNYLTIESVLEFLKGAVISAKPRHRCERRTDLHVITRTASTITNRSDSAIGASITPSAPHAHGLPRPQPASPTVHAVGGSASLKASSAPPGA